MIRKTINVVALLTIAFGASATGLNKVPTLRAAAMCQGGGETCFCESGKCVAYSGGCYCK
jgi:hypothetical protein